MHPHDLVFKKLTDLSSQVSGGICYNKLLRGDVVTAPELSYTTVYDKNVKRTETSKNSRNISMHLLSNFYY